MQSDVYDVQARLHRGVFGGGTPPFGPLLSSAKSGKSRLKTDELSIFYEIIAYFWQKILFQSANLTSIPT